MGAWLAFLPASLEAHGLIHILREATTHIERTYEDLLNANYTTKLIIFSKYWLLMETETMVLLQV